MKAYQCSPPTRVFVCWGISTYPSLLSELVLQFFSSTPFWLGDLEQKGFEKNSQKKRSTSHLPKQLAMKKGKYIFCKGWLKNTEIFEISHLEWKKGYIWIESCFILFLNEENIKKNIDLHSRATLSPEFCWKLLN